MYVMQAAFISSYLHSSLIFAVALVFSYTVYTSADDPIGTIDNVWRNLNVRSEVCLVLCTCALPCCVLPCQTQSVSCASEMHARVFGP
jgi:hypothetical protein